MKRKQSATPPAGALYLAKRTCSKVFRDRVLYLYPGLGDRYDFWRLLEWLIYAPWVESGTGRLIMHCDTLKVQVDGPARFSLSKLADEFSQEVFPIEVGEFNLVEAKRFLSELPSELTSLIDQEFSKCHQPRVERVYFCDGSPFNARAIAAERAQSRSTALFEVKMAAANSKASCGLATDLLGYLNNLPANRFRSVLDHMEEAYAIVGSVAIDPMRERRCLKAIEDQWQPFYAPTKEKIGMALTGEQAVCPGTVRVFSSSSSVAILKREVRECLLQGTIKVDLRSAQFAILAGIWNLERISEFLANPGGPSIWSELHRWMGLEPTQESKEHFKKILYSIAFGMGDKKLKQRFLESFRSSGSWLRFRKNPMIAELLKARKKIRDQIRLQGFGVDAFGITHPVVRRISKNEKRFVKTNENSIMSLIAQSYELKLMEPVIRGAMNSGGSTGFTIMCWLHDGCYIKPHDSRPERVSKLLSQLTCEVKEQAQRLGIRTELEWENL